MSPPCASPTAVCPPSHHCEDPAMFTHAQSVIQASITYTCIHHMCCLATKSPQPMHSISGPFTSSATLILFRQVQMLHYQTTDLHRCCIDTASSAITALMQTHRPGFTTSKLHTAHVFMLKLADTVKPAATALESYKQMMNKLRICDGKTWLCCGWDLQPAHLLTVYWHRSHWQ